MTRGTHLRRLLCLLAAFTLLAAACSDDDDDGDAAASADQEEEDGGGDGEGRLAEVQDRGTLNCGVNNQVPGFGFETEDGFEGFDIDFCKAVAAAVVGDPEAVQYEPLTPEERFTALQRGDIDVLIRNTTWTSTRDGAEGAAFTTTSFYDGQAMMVPSDAGVSSIDDLEGAVICMTAGTTTEQNLADRMSGISHTPETFRENSQVQDAFLAGQCDAWTSDQSQLAGIRSAWPEDAGGPEALTVLDEVFSKEPLGPAVRDGDSEWFDVINWIVIATIQAEEFGVTQDNVEEMAESDDVSIRRFLGQPVPDEEDPESEAVVDHGLGIDNDFTMEVIGAVGNYAEIFERNVGPDTALGLERGVNALWSDGGLHYPPPFR
jgi:general L-amino acid transport system substrate-binding protein